MPGQAIGAGEMILVLPWHPPAAQVKGNVFFVGEHVVLNQSCMRESMEVAVFLRDVG